MDKSFVSAYLRTDSRAAPRTLNCGCAEPYPITVYLAPEDAQLAALAVAADKRWEAAGVVPERVVVVPWGMPGAVPLRWQPAESMRRACEVPAGYQHTPLGCVDYLPSGAPERVWFSRAAGGSVMELEMGHLLGVVDHISDVGALMREDSGDWQITDADLTAACSVGPCTGWAPEVAL